MSKFDLTKLRPAEPWCGERPRKPGTDAGTDEPEGDWRCWLPAGHGGGWHFGFDHEMTTGFCWAVARGAGYGGCDAQWSFYMNEPGRWPIGVAANDDGSLVAITLSPSLGEPPRSRLDTAAEVRGTDEADPEEDDDLAEAARDEASTARHNGERTRRAVQRVEVSPDLPAVEPRLPTHADRGAGDDRQSERRDRGFAQDASGSDGAATTNSSRITSRTTVFRGCQPLTMHWSSSVIARHQSAAALFTDLQIAILKNWIQIW